MLWTMNRLPVVSIAVYTALGSPRRADSLSYSQGRCGICLHEAESAPALEVVSKSFGSWADIAVCSQRNGRFLCAPCICALRSLPLRRQASVITTAPTLRQPTQAELQTLLLTGSLPGDTAVLAPVSGKKAIVLNARWGMVATDSGALSWQPGHARALAALLRLRALGFRESGFSEQMPPWVTLRNLPAAERKEAQQLWQSLSLAREDRVVLPLLAKLSRSDS